MDSNAVLSGYRRMQDRRTEPLLMPRVERGLAPQQPLEIGPSAARVDIRPGVSMLAVLRHLNYKAWYALAEFVDNSIQSFIANRARLERLHGSGYKLQVSIDIDSAPPGRIVIRDNAAGVDRGSYQRAFRPAAIPPDRTGLSEFGMGMKSAACWFSPDWRVRTSALGEADERTIHFDIARIVHDDLSELDVATRPADAEAHFTEVILDRLHRPPVGRTIGKLKEHLADIYRVFIREGLLELRFNGELLRHEEPQVLVAPYFREPAGPNRMWRKEISFDLGSGLSVRGFAAIRATASVSGAGFALFRRRRLIQGSGDEGYRPEQIVGKPNSYAYQRIFGELHLEGFEVTHTKDGFRWDENEQPFLELLREHLDSDDLPLLHQANGYRARVARSLAEGAASEALARTIASMERTLEPVLAGLATAPPVPQPPSDLAAAIDQLAAREFDVRFQGQSWRIRVELTNDPAEREWLAIGERSVGPDENGFCFLGLRVSLAHPFMMRFAPIAADGLEGLIRIAAALGLSEMLARQSGVRYAGTVRRNVNDILRDALSQP